MDRKEYDELQKMLTDKIHEGDRRFPHAPNISYGWKEAILYVKSMLHGKFKLKENESENSRK